MMGFSNCVISVEGLWKANHNREELYLQAMALENFISLRKVCSLGHISSILFQRELSSIYDQVKCPLAPKGLGMDVNIQAPIIAPEENNQLCIIWALKECERKAIELYQCFLSTIEMDILTEHLLNDHLEQLREIDSKLSSELKIKHKKPAAHIPLHESIVKRHRFIIN